MNLNYKALTEDIELVMQTTAERAEELQRITDENDEILEEHESKEKAMERMKDLCD